MDVFSVNVYTNTRVSLQSVVYYLCLKARFSCNLLRWSYFEFLFNGLYVLSFLMYTNTYIFLLHKKDWTKIVLNNSKDFRLLDLQKPRRNIRLEQMTRKSGFLEAKYNKTNSDTFSLKRHLSVSDLPLLPRRYSMLSFQAGCYC